MAMADYRGRRTPIVHIEMTRDEFREMVEWLEMLAPDDACTRDWREQHDRLFPPETVDGD